MQRNWIGRSEGAEVQFSAPEMGVDYPVFTTRPDTLFGATFFVMAPEHPDVLRLAAGTEHEQAAREYIDAALPEDGPDTALAPPGLLAHLRSLMDPDGMLPPWSRWS